MKKRSRLLSAMLAAVAAAAVLSGCGSSSSSEGTAAQNAGGAAAPSGSEAALPAGDTTDADGILKYGTDTWPAGYDPHTISAVAAVRVLNQVYEQLVTLNEDMTIGPELAESWETPDDKTYIFKLRQGVKFQNGREMTAEDVQYSFQRILGQTEAGDIGALGSSASYYGDIASMEVVDPYTIKFVLNQPNASFLSNLGSTYGSIVCKEVVEENNGSLSEISTMCGTGPFKYKDSVVDNYIALEKNPDYRDAANVKLNGVTFYLLADESTRLAALRTGSIDLTPLSALNVPDVEKDENIQVLSYQSNNYTYLGFNLSNPALQDVRVRHALSLASDRQAIIDYVYNGDATVSTFVAPAMGHWVWDATSESPLYQYNVEEAKKLMEEAGYSDSNRLKLKTAAGLLDSIRDTAVILQQQYKEIYVDLEISNLESGEYVDVWKKMSTPEAGFDLMVGQNGSGTDPNRAVSFFFSSTGGANVFGYSNPKVDELSAEGNATVDESKRESIYLEAQKLIVEDSPNLWFASPIEYMFADKKLKGYEPTAVDATDFTHAYFE